MEEGLTNRVVFIHGGWTYQQGGLYTWRKDLPTEWSVYMEEGFTNRGSVYMEEGLTNRGSVYMKEGLTNRVVCIHEGRN